jgi:hypothetical protein
LGRREESDAALKALIERSPKASAFAIAQLHAFRGERDATFEWLNRACAEPQGGCEHLKTDRFLRGVSDDPRYRALLVRMKLSSEQASATN